MSENGTRRLRLRALAARYGVELRIGLDPYGLTVAQLGDGDEDRALDLLRAMWLALSDDERAAAGRDAWAARVFGGV